MKKTIFYLIVIAAADIALLAVTKIRYRDL